jgi:F420-non-reducing hydrogenase iron-sulfur subunit
MCSGRVSPHFVLKAFQKGADGVLISACHLGECHYSKGNFMTAKRVTMLKEMLKFMGVGDERLRFEYIATSESGKLARVFSSFTEDIRALGPSPLRRKGSARG